jgi:hypothetical protein
MNKLCSTCGGVIFAIGVLTAPDILTTVCRCKEEEIPAHTHTESPIIILMSENMALSGATASSVIAGETQQIIKQINKEIDKLKI